MQALLPIKNISIAKERLSRLLDSAQRQALSYAMIHDVLAVLAEQPEISGVALVSEDPIAADLAFEYGAELVTEASLKAAGLNKVVQATVSMFALRNITDVMIVHGDLPLVNRTALSELIALHDSLDGPRVTVAPDRHREGSNCLLCSPAASFNFMYGTDSFIRHCASAKKLKFKLQVLDDPDLGCDIDYPEDLACLLHRVETGNARQTVKCLSKHGITAETLKGSGVEPFSQGHEYEWVS